VSACRPGPVERGGVLPDEIVLQFDVARGDKMCSSNNYSAFVKLG
jgi:hypothetical protein